MAHLLYVLAPFVCFSIGTKYAEKPGSNSSKIRPTNGLGAKTLPRRPSQRRKFNRKQIDCVSPDHISVSCRTLWILALSSSIHFLIVFSWKEEEKKTKIERCWKKQTYNLARLHDRLIVYPFSFPSLFLSLSLSRCSYRVSGCMVGF